MTNPTIDRAARAIAAAIVHGTSPDPALDAARALDDLGLLVHSAAIGRTRPAPSPAAVAALAECRKAKHVADEVHGIDGLPGDRDVSAAGGEVTVVVHPQSLADWRQWTHALGAGGTRGESTGVSMIVRCRYGGVRARLVGVGVPALYQDMPSRGTAVRT